MAKVTPITITYTILLILAVLMLTLPTINYYASATTNATLYQTLNNSYTALNKNFTANIYGPVYSATYNSSSGLKASGSLQQFTGLAFMFGSMYQVAVAVGQGIPIINTVLATVAQFSILPDVNVFALLGLFLAGAVSLLIWFWISNWTKVES